MNNERNADDNEQILILQASQLNLTSTNFDLLFGDKNI